jgi:regulatory LuxR family protein
MIMRWSAGRCGTCWRPSRILELIGEGLTNRQIGERMFLAEKTVKNYVSALFARLGMERRTRAAAYAVRVLDDQHNAAGHEGYSGPDDEGPCSLLPRDGDQAFS